MQLRPSRVAFQRISRNWSDQKPEEEAPEPQYNDQGELILPKEEGPWNKQNADKPSNPAPPKKTGSLPMRRFSTFANFYYVCSFGQKPTYSVTNLWEMNNIVYVY